MADDFGAAIEALGKRADEPEPQGELQQAIEALGQRSGQPGEYGRPAPQTAPQVDPNLFQSGAAGPAAGSFRSSQETGVQPDQDIFDKAVGRLFGTDVQDPRPLTRMGTTITAGITGGVYGSRVPGPPIVKALGAVAGGMAGTIAGAAAPEATIEGLEELGLLEEGTRDRTGLSNEDLLTVVEGEALLEAFTVGGVSAVRLGKRGLTNIFTGATKETKRLAEYGSREGIALLPVQVGSGRFARGFVSVMGRFPWVAGALKKKAQRSMDQIAGAFDNIPQRFGPLTTFDEASASILKESQETVGALQRSYNKQFQELLQQADFRKVKIRPVNTRAVTERLLRQLQRETPEGVEGVRGRLPKGAQGLQQFLRENTSILYAGNQIADQSMRRMDTLLNAIDEKIVTAAKSSDQKAMSRYESLRQAIQMDMVNNPIGEGAKELAGQFRQLDEELTYSVNALLANSTGKKLGAVVSPTLRSARFGGLGTRGIDSLAKSILSDGSVTAVEELARLTNPQTMRQLTGAVFNEAIQKAFVSEGGDVVRFDADVFARQIGLDAPSSGRYRQTSALLQRAGGLSMNELGDLVDIARRASRAEIPDVSTFVARGATIGGLQRLWNVLVPGALIGGATAANVQSGMVLGILTIGGSRFLSRMISDPKSARALGRVIDQEVKTSIKWAAGVRAFEFTVQNLRNAGELTASEANNMINAYHGYTDTLRGEYKRQEANGE